jgi:hypothetical protein
MSLPDRTLPSWSTWSVLSNTLVAEDGMHYLLLDTTDPPRNLPVAVTGVPDTSVVSYCNGGQPLVRRVSRR